MGHDPEILITGPNISKDIVPPEDIKVSFLASRFFSIAERSREFLEYLEDLNPDVIMFNADHLADAVIPMIPEEIKTIGVLHCDSDEHYERLEAYGKYWDSIVTVSDYIREESIRLHPELEKKINYVPSGILMPPFSPKKVNLQTLRLVYSGRVEEDHKRFCDVVALVNILKKKKIDFHLDVIGSGGMFPVVEKLWEKENKVTLHGEIPPENVLPLLEKADIMLLTSDYEGFSLSLLEGMAVSCVPLVYDIKSGVPQVIEDGETGFVVRRGDLYAMADRLEKLAANREELNRISSQSRRRVEKSFTLDKMSQGFINILNDLAQSPEKKKNIKPIKSRTLGNLRLLSPLQVSPDKLMEKSGEHLYLRRRIQGSVKKLRVCLVLKEVNGHGIPDNRASLGYHIGSMIAAIPSVDLKVIAENLPREDSPLKDDLKRKWFVDFPDLAYSRGVNDAVAGHLISQNYDAIVLVSENELAKNLFSHKKRYNFDSRIVVIDQSDCGGSSSLWKDPEMDMDSWPEKLIKSDIILSPNPDWDQYTNEDIIRYVVPNPYPGIEAQLFLSNSPDTSHLLFWGNLHNNIGLQHLDSALNNIEPELLPLRLSFLGMKGMMPGGKRSTDDFINELDHRYPSMIVENIPAFSYADELTYLRTFRGILIYHNPSANNFLIYQALAAGMPLLANRSFFNRMIIDDKYLFDSSDKDMARILSQREQIKWQRYNNFPFQQLTKFWRRVVMPRLSDFEEWRFKDY